MQALERDSDSDEEMVTSPTSPATYRPSPYELLRNAKIEINCKYLESIGLEKAASELKKQALPSQKENKTAGKKSSLGNVEDAAVTPTRKTRPKQKCTSTETAMVKKKQMTAKQRHERKKLRTTARTAAKEDNNAKLDEELEKLARIGRARHWCQSSKRVDDTHGGQNGRQRCDREKTDDEGRRIISNWDYPIVSK
ncbi:hypothetical protein ACA910_018257 [Epithemia clementina (nom. ined.)]